MVQVLPTSGQHRRGHTQAESVIWMDELWTVALVSPIFLAMIAGYDGAVRRGYMALAEAPPWIIHSVEAAIAFAFYRRYSRSRRHDKAQLPTGSTPGVLPQAAVK